VSIFADEPKKRSKWHQRGEVRSAKDILQLDHDTQLWWVLHLTQGLLTNLCNTLY
jgi:hypothetical protein